MIVFWLAIVVLTLIALMFLLWPFWGQTSERTVVITLLLIVPAVSLSLYLYWGKSAEVATMLANKQNEHLVKQQIAQYGSRENIIKALSAKLNALPQTPESARGWYILGKLYFNQQDYSNALSAFKKAAELKPQETEFVMQHISAKFFVNQKLDNTDKEQLTSLIAAAPTNVNAINLLALDAYQNKNYASAIRYWESLLRFFPADSQDANALLQMIKEAQNHLGSSTDQAVIEALVNITPQLKEQLRPNDSLFVYAVAAGGPKIPLAVAKLSANQLPMTVKLDQNSSMINGRSLTASGEVIIKARVSSSGAAMTAKGDLVGTSKIVKLHSGTNQVNILIDTRLDTLD